MNPSIDKIIALWISDPAFRDAFEANPQGACCAANIAVAPEALGAMAALDLGGLSAGTLPARMSHMGISHPGQCRTQ